MVSKTIIALAVLLAAFCVAQGSPAETVKKEAAAPKEAAAEKSEERAAPAPAAPSHQRSANDVFNSIVDAAKGNVNKFREYLGSWASQLIGN